MTETECKTILARCAVYWPHQPLPDSAVLGWMDLLGSQPADTIAEAVRLHAVGGAEFPPPPGVILKIIRDTQNPAEWDAVLAEIRAKLKELNRDRRSTYGPLGDVWQTPALDEWTDPQIAELIERSGGIGAWMQMVTIGFPGTVDDTTFLAQQRNLWASMRGRTIDHGRMRSVGAQKLEALSRGPRHISDLADDLRAAAPPELQKPNPTQAAA